MFKTATQPFGSQIRKHAGHTVIGTCSIQFGSAHRHGLVIFSASSTSFCFTLYIGKLSRSVGQCWVPLPCAFGSPCFELDTRSFQTGIVPGCSQAQPWYIASLSPQELLLAATVAQTKNQKRHLPYFSRVLLWHCQDRSAKANDNQ